jgi:hypothetical protein
VTDQSIKEIGTKIDKLISVLEAKEMNVEVQADPSRLVDVKIVKSLGDIKKRLAGDSSTRALSEKFV